MAHELFYVTASAPARFSISGKIYNLQAGESRGPFSKQEADQLSSSSDRQRLHIMPVSVPKGQTAPQMTTEANKPETEPLYRGVTNATVDPKFEDPFVANATESLNLFPDTEPSKTIAEEKEEQKSTKGEALPEPEVEPNLTSMAEGQGNEEPKPKTTAKRSSGRRKAAVKNTTNDEVPAEVESEE